MQTEQTQNSFNGPEELPGLLKNGPQAPWWGIMQKIIAQLTTLAKYFFSHILAGKPVCRLYVWVMSTFDDRRSGRGSL